MSQVPEQLQSAIASRYRLERQIGRGGMATVYLGRDIKHDRPVAVKVLLPALGALLGAERFLREIKMVARLQHPHILPLYDSGEADGMVYYVMPYVAGDSLRDRLRRERRLQLHDALRITRDVADALYYAHGNGVVHRDIKPENILLSDTYAIVADFGIARAVHAAGGEQWETLTECGVAVGTPAYMSPEQTVGDTNVDGRSDIYSLGCVMYEMLAGAPPFTGPDGTVLLAKRFTDPPPSISIVRDDVPQPVDEAIRRALAREPADRHANALDLINAIWEERSATVHAAARRTVRAPKRRRRILLAAGGVGIAAAVGGVSLATRRPASRAGAPGEVASSVAAHPDTVAAVRAGTLAAPRDTGAASAPAASGAKAPDSVVAPSIAPTVPPAQRMARIPHRETPVAPPRRDTAVASRPDTVLASLRRAAIQTRTRAAASGASPLDLAPGDSLFTDSYASAGEGRRADALVQLSRAAGAWAAAVRTVRIPAKSDSQPANADSQPGRRTVAAPPNVTARAPVVASTTVRGTDSAAARDIERDPRPEIDALIGHYARAIESRSTAAIGELYPSITAAQRRDWEQFFQTVRDIRVRLTVTRLDVAGRSADARVEGVYEYSNTSTHRMEQHPVSFRVSLQRGAAGWRVRAIE